MGGEDDKNMTQFLASFSHTLPSRFKLARVFETNSFDKETELLGFWKSSNLSGRTDWPKEQSIKVAICGFSTLNYLKPHLTWAALADGIVPHVVVGNYNQLFQELASIDSSVTEQNVEILWVWAELRDLLPQNVLGDSNLLLSNKGLEAVELSIESLMKTLKALRIRFRGFILVNDFCPDRMSPFGIADSNRAVQHEQFYRRANELLQKGLSEITYSATFPLSGLIRNYGLHRAIDRRLQILADCRFTPEFYFELAKAFRPYIRSLKAIMKKVLVLDLDNTLWSGVVGEDGWDKVKIGGDGAGKAFAKFQAAILELHNRGVILAINSKNNPGDVDELFLKRQEMILKPEHFAAIRTNWQDKGTNCMEIAEEINVGLDSLVFWDDNPAERLFVKENLEQIYVVEPPEDPAQWADYLLNLGLFDCLQLSSEDTKRGRMYAQERLRRKMASSAPDMKSFLCSLELEVEVQSASEQNLPRIVALLSRTNQFNLTTRRHSEQIIRDWMANDDFRITCYAAKDRFGSYGIVGVTVLGKRGNYVEIDSLLLSCRAIGKDIENAMLAVLARQAKQLGASIIKADYIPTKKNAPIRDFLPNSGFVLLSESDGKRHYEIDLRKEQLKQSQHIKLKVTG